MLWCRCADGIQCTFLGQNLKNTMKRHFCKLEFSKVYSVVKSQHRGFYCATYSIWFIHHVWIVWAIFWSFDSDQTARVVKTYSTPADWSPRTTDSVKTKSWTLKVCVLHVFWKSEETAQLNVIAVYSCYNWI